MSAEKKSVGSTAGMQTTVSTSSLYKYRTDHVVPQRMQLMEEAINNRDFETFADITMQVSVLIPRMVRQQLTAEWFFYLGFFAVLFHRDSSF